MPLLDRLDQIFASMIGKPTDGEAALAVGGVAEETEDPYADTKAIALRVTDFVKDCDKSRWAFERQWFRSVLYYLGNQWLTWDGRSRKWRERKLRKWVPKPVTNRFASTVDSIVSAIQGTKVLPSAWPATSDPRDIGAANVADRVLDVIGQEIKSERVRQHLAKWIVLCGDAFAYVHYDKLDKTLGLVRINSVACPLCQHVAQPLEFESGVCPGCQQPTEPQPAEDVFEEYPTGRMCCDVLSPLEVYLSLDIPLMENHTKCTIVRRMTKDQLETLYGDKAKDLPIDSAASTKSAQYFMKALAYSTEDMGNNMAGFSGSEVVTIYTHIELPSVKYPEGLEVVMGTDETVLECGPSPHFDTDITGNKQYYLPLCKIGYEKVPGRLYSKTPAYDIVPKQDQLNRLESLIELAMMKGTYGTWLLPTGSSISEIAGEPGLKIKYTPTGTGGFKPEVITNSPIPPIVLEWKTQIQADFEELGGTFDVLKGNAPRGVSAGYAIQLLTERSYGKFASVFAEWEEGWTELYQKSLKMFRTYVTEPRLRKIKGSCGHWEIQSFKNSDLAGAVDLRVEGGASKPRSKIAEQALVETLSKLGVINTQDPEQRYQVAQMFGMGQVLGAQDEDVRYAAGEWEELLAWQPPVDPMTGEPFVDPNMAAQGKPWPEGGPQADEIFDNHMVHVSEHRKPTRSDEWKQLPKWKQLFWKQHMITHLIALQPVVDPAAQKPEKPESFGKNAETKPSKADEKSDKTTDAIRSGGNNTMGSGGKNQY